ncbi:MAG: glycosyltransferase involved in cell wall biosynthesis [Maribacter sp.]|jgi:glycosyltransferase involved in cell wall biosynthesis
MKAKILITIPNIKAPGGVSYYWDAIVPHLANYDEIACKTFEVGAYGTNLLAPIKDLWNFRKEVKAKTKVVVLNPSLGIKSFFRDAIFSKILISNKIPFIVFFHGWDLDFEKTVTNRYINFFKNTFGKAQKIIVLSQEFKKTLRLWGFKGEIALETTAVDNDLLKNYRHNQRPRIGDGFRILFLSRLLKEKGVYETIEAFRNISKDYSSVQLTIAGDGAEFEALKQFIKNDDNILMTGNVSGKEKINVFSTSDIYCLPSYYGEGLPTTVLEAMAFGIPVITTRAGGLKTFFQENKMGYFVEYKNPKGLEQKLRMLISNPEDAYKIGKFNHQFAMKNVMGDKVAKKIYGHIHDLLY